MLGIWRIIQGLQWQQKLSYLKSLKYYPPPNKDMGMYYEIQKWLPYQILGDKTVKNVKIDCLQRRYGRNS